MVRKYINLVLSICLVVTILSGCSESAISSSSSSSQTGSSSIAISQNLSVSSTPPVVPKEETERQIKATTKNGDIIVFSLNNSRAADELYNQLPLSTWVDDYAGNEKIFYPPQKLDTTDTPLASGPIGTLAYYAPWGDVAIYYGECGGASGLYALGEAISGAEYISEITGEIKLEAYMEGTTAT